MLFNAPKARSPSLNAYLNSDWRLCESSSEVRLWIGLPPSAGVFSIWLRRLISARREDWSCLVQRRHFPTTWGILKMRMGPASRIPHQGCRNSVTPDILSFSSLRLTRVTPLFGSAQKARFNSYRVYRGLKLSNQGSARSEHGCEMYNGQVTLRSMEVNGAFCTVISPADPNIDSRPSSSRRRSGSQDPSRLSA